MASTVREARLPKRRRPQGAASRPETVAQHLQSELVGWTDVCMDRADVCLGPTTGDVAMILYVVSKVSQPTTIKNNNAARYSKSKNV